MTAFRRRSGTRFGSYQARLNTLQSLAMGWGRPCITPGDPADDLHLKIMSTILSPAPRPTDPETTTARRCRGYGDNLRFFPALCERRPQRAGRRRAARGRVTSRRPDRTSVPGRRSPGCVGGLPPPPQSAAASALASISGAGGGPSVVTPYSWAAATRVSTRADRNERDHVIPPRYRAVAFGTAPMVRCMPFIATGRALPGRL
jgi:hypothetical protein